MSAHDEAHSNNAGASTARVDLTAEAGRHPGLAFPVVGVGASAGGLDAFKTLLAALPAETGMAFVLIQHLDPKHASFMADLLASRTRMPVSQAVDGVSIEPNHVYLIPPAVSLAVSNGKLLLAEPAERHGARMPFDFFLRSLAKDCGRRAMCVLLSGTGTDGSEGLKAIKDNGGFVIVQDPLDAQFDGMPKSAISTGMADVIAPIAKISSALVKHSTHLLSSRPKSRAKEGVAGRLAEILDLVRTKTAHDFTVYKTGTLTRRIERRMAVAAIADAGRYVDRLRADPAELDSLAQDLLINVTQYFRDQAAFETLAESVIPQMIAAHAADRPLRIWVPGCSTGEEAYSLAILFLEAMEAWKRPLKLQVFASDIDASSIEVAREGVYGCGTDDQVSAIRLSRFFCKEGDLYRVRRELRETVVFTVQDLLSDPPFSRLDLISCRNVLIYLRPDAQEKVLSLFHFALHAGGVLFIGPSETIGAFTDRFEPINKKFRIYRHLSASRAGEGGFRPSVAAAERAGPAVSALSRKISRRPSLGDLASKVLVEIFAPASVLIDKKYEALYYSGNVDRFLQIAPGEDNRNVLLMAREGLRPKLRAALEGARETGEPASKTGAQAYRDGKALGVKIAVQPISAEDLFLVSFIDEPESTPPSWDSHPPEDTSRILQLEQELDATRKELNAVIRDLEIANEDQRGVNEGALSMNEELQSANEELETSKEELQSLNEELTALNAQLQETLEHQRTTAADLQNILNSSDVSTLFLDIDLNIRFFTPASRSLFGVSAVDIGRPLIDLAQRFRDENLLPDARAVLSQVTPVRREIESNDGNWFIRSIMPYRNDVSAVEGVVLTFARISEMKAAERKIEAAKAYAESIIATVKQPLVVLDRELRVVSASASFFEFFGAKPEECVGKPLEFGDHLKEGPLADLLDPALEGSAVEDRQLKIELPKLGPRTLRVSARLILPLVSESPLILISFDDITETRTEAEAMAAAKEEAERANLAKSRFLAAVSHDLRQPLQTMTLVQGMLSETISDPAAKALIERLDCTVIGMSSLLDKILNINQLEAGVVQAKLCDFVIGDLLEQLKSEFQIHAANDGVGLRVVPCHLMLRSDPRLLEQILRNLLSNALKYTSRGKVLLGCRRRGESLSIEVWDTGTGIPETELGAIFKEYHQLDNHVTKGGKGLGLGLGLAIVHHLADLLHAPIRVRSRVGRGSVFALEVPVVRISPAEPPSLDKSGTDRIPRARGSHTILIVEDDEEVRDALKLLLDRHGYLTLAARDGAQALALASDVAKGVDLIIADYNLPGADGLEAIARIEEASALKIPAILLTGDISASTLLEIAARGHVHLYKPANPRTLIRHINAILDKSSRKDLLSDDDGKVHVSNTKAAPLNNGSQKALASTVFVVDDAQDIREALRDMLQQHGHRAELFADASTFLKDYSPNRAGCLVADVRMPGIGGLELIERLGVMQSSLPVIILTAYGDVAMAVMAMKAGAFDFLEKPVQPDELLRCIERALKFSDEHYDLSADRNIAASKIESLSARQRQVLELVLAGTSSKNIAADLKISQRTVDNHRAAIMRKLGAKSLSAMIRTALAAALVQK
jgi:two-component system CheB/CheR fusion protein